MILCGIKHLTRLNLLTLTASIICVSAPDQVLQAAARQNVITPISWANKYSSNCQPFSITDNPFRFSTAYFDPESGLYCSQGSYYSPEYMTSISKPSTIFSNNQPSCNNMSLGRCTTNFQMNEKLRVALACISPLSGIAIVGGFIALMAVSASLQNPTSITTASLSLLGIGAGFIISVLCIRFALHQWKDYHNLRIDWDKEKNIPLSRIGKLCIDSSESFTCGDYVARCPCSHDHFIYLGSETVRKISSMGMECQICHKSLRFRTLQPLHSTPNSVDANSGPVTFSLPARRSPQRIEISTEKTPLINHQV